MKVEENVMLLPYDLQWFAPKEGPGGEKTEQATAKKLKEARDEGKVAKSTELSSGLNLLALFLALKFAISFVGGRLIGVFQLVYNGMPDFVLGNRTDLNPQAVMGLGVAAGYQMLLAVLPFFIVGVIIAFASNIMQFKFQVTGKPLQPKFDKLNPVNGFKKIFSAQSLFELVKSIVKIALIFYIAYLSIKDQANSLFLLYDIPFFSALSLIGSIVIDTGIKISIVYLFVGVADFMYQKYRFKEDMKMTKQEVKDEYKNTEGDPQIKAKQKQKMREVSMRRMMSDVPKADVVITNPTHISVAIRYDSTMDSAPVIVAKGEDYVALRIREVAKENQVAIVENKPLARALYATVDIGEMIPPELYQAVAEVLAIVYNNRNV